MKLDLRPLKPEVLACRVIPRADPQLFAQLTGGQAAFDPERRALGLVTCTSDDALYVALDEGTKAAPVDVVYARSFYAGAAHASGPLSGEVIGVYAGRDPDEIHAALAACRGCLENEAWFYAADDAGRLAFFPHVVSSLGHYLAAQSGLPVGSAMAYLIAPPLESVVGVDAALKAAPTTLAKWFGPPSETNFGGAYLAGALPDVEASARAFAAAVVDVARHPTATTRDARAAGDALGARPARSEGGPSGLGRYRVLASGERLAAKPEHLTHLFDDESLVPKTHPRIVLRGKLDLLQCALLDAQVAADEAGFRPLVGELGELLELSRSLVGAEVTGKALPPLRLLGLDDAQIRWTSHHTWDLYAVPFMYPDVRMGPVVARLGLARAHAREAELAALAAFPPEGPEPREDLVVALNRASSVLYVMTCKFVGGRYEGKRPLSGPVRGWRPPKSGAR